MHCKNSLLKGLELTRNFNWIGSFILAKSIVKKIFYCLWVKFLLSLLSRALYISSKFRKCVGPLWEVSLLTLSCCQAPIWKLLCLLLSIRSGIILMLRCHQTNSSHQHLNVGKVWPQWLSNNFFCLAPQSCWWSLKASSLFLPHRHFVFVGGF